MNEKRILRWRCPPHRGRRGGYSLIELMLALGIMAFALPMIATSILSGMVENQESFDSTMAAIVAENAISAIRSRISDEDLVEAWGSGQTAMQPIPERIALPGGDKVLYRPEDLAWTPLELEANPEESAFWCVVYGQRMTAEKNDYRLLAIPYKKYEPNAQIDQVNVTVDAASNKVTQYEVILKDTDVSAAVGFLVVRTALRPWLPTVPASGGN